MQNIYCFVTSVTIFFEVIKYGSTLETLSQVKVEKKDNKF